MVAELRNCSVKISLRRPRYLPGQYVEALISVKNQDIEKKIYVQNLSVEFVGQERLDLQWVKPYTDGRQPILKDGRKQIFEIFKCSQTLFEEQLIQSGDSIRCLVRLKLPSQLPPSFKGKAVRYMYTLVASAKYGTVLSEQQSNDAPELLVDHYSDIVQRKPFQIQPRKSLSANGNGSLPFVRSTQSFEDVDVPMIEYESGSQQQDLQIQYGILKDNPESGEELENNPSMHLPYTQLGGRVKLSYDQQQFSEVLSSNGLSLGSMEGDEEGFSTDGEGQYLMAASSLGSQISPGGETLRDVGVVSTRTYVLRLRDEVLMRCSMNQSIGVVKPGSSISGVMDFRKGEEESESVGARVRQVVLSLETEESVQSDHLVNSRQSQGSVVRCLYEEPQFVVQDVYT
eukprot:TRINITY_DN2043_c0_g1_i9.p2 TRINITY_DN2043_c0_g1~~TRINITY_DN2043_c0_g1_i9.p2  ORF type:complete len:400 (-),score=58.62 TRINITY_DN2043_c0_g1_i9:39-1238(-)